MHGAPSVSYPAGRSRLAAGLLAGAWLLGCAAGLAWWLQSPDAWRLALMAAALVASGGLAAWNWWRQPPGALDWDGEAWTWSGRHGAAAGRVQVALDLQHALLLRWTAGASAQWLWLARADRPERWDDLRRAVYSRARSQAPQPAAPPAATP